jgi:FtsZ-binding cell division protein ZapB
MPAGVKQAEDLDTLSSLEERITRTVDLVTQLRADNQVLEAELQTARTETDRISQELDEVRAERKQVRTRIEKLLGQMDLLSDS